MKKIIALVLALAMVAALGLAFADTTTQHTIEVTTNGDGAHTYGAYQIFKGNLDATGTKLSNIEWGSSMNDTAVAALKSALSTNDTFKACNTVQDFADALNGIANDAAQAKAFADAIATALEDASPVASNTTDTTKKTTITVTGDGYYFVKDISAVGDYDTQTRFMLQVLGNVKVTAKDTKLTPDKEIVNEDGTDVTPTKDNDASIGDVITYNVTVPVPDTSLYKKNFRLKMYDTLDTGLTYFGGMTITVNTDPLKTLTPSTDYTTTVKTGNAAFTTPETANAAVKTTGGQSIEVVFNNFKQLVESAGLAGKTITISYQVVLNENAEMGVLPNENDVYFKYSNNPNHEYDGEGDDDDDDDDVYGETPHDKTKTFVTKLELDKVDGANNQALAGAEFLLTGTTWNNVLVTGEKFEKDPYTAKTGETVQDGTYYLLKDGSYTTTAKTDVTAAQYDATTDTFVKVTFAKVVKEAKNVNLTLVTGEDGKIIVEGIEQGTYTLKETKAPTGYNLDETEYTLNIAWSNPDATGASDKLKDAGGFSIGANSSEQFEMDTNGARFHITIKNNQGTVLPSTGGIGTTIFYIVGGLLLVGAAVILVARKKAGN